MIDVLNCMNHLLASEQHACDPMTFALNDLSGYACSPARTKGGWRDICQFHRTKTALWTLSFSSWPRIGEFITLFLSFEILIPRIAIDLRISTERSDSRCFKHAPRRQTKLCCGVFGDISFLCRWIWWFWFQTMRASTLLESSFANSVALS